MKRILLILFLIITGTAYGNTFGKNGGVIPDQATNIGGIGADGQFHFVLLGNDGTMPNGANYASDATLQASAVANGNGTAMDVSGLAGVAVQITGLGTATINWEGTIDGTNWVVIQLAAIGTQLSANTASANGIYNGRVNGLKQFRARISSYSSGTIIITAHGTPDAAGGLVATRIIDPGNGAVSTAGTADGQAGGLGMWTPASQYQYNGATNDKVRVPTIFKPFTISASAAETTVWTPTAGKKFRVMGWTLFSDTATVLTFRDNTAGTIIYKTGVGASANNHPSGFGNGVISSAANNVLTLQAATASTINGTVYGTEE